MGILQPDGSPVPAACVDYTLTACISRMSYAGAAPRPEVVLRRPAPADLRAHHAAFGPRVRRGEHPSPRLPPLDREHAGGRGGRGAEARGIALLAPRGARALV